MQDYFEQDERLGIPVPVLQHDWHEISHEVQQSILLYWEEIRGSIPDRISNLEKVINMKQGKLFDESDFKISCLLNTEIAELASIINDLWLWFRSNQVITEKMHQ